MFAKCKKCEAEISISTSGPYKSLCKKCISEQIHQLELKSPFLQTGMILENTKEIDCTQLFDQNTTYGTARLQNYCKIPVSGRDTCVLGKGAYGEVWLVQNKITKDRYAMKMFDKRRIFIGKTQQIVKDLEREINIQKKLRHDNIIRLYDAMSDKDRIYLLMEYASGGSLFHHIRNKNYLSEIEAFKLFVQVCSAIHFLHKNSLIHRDIKPENVLLANNGRAKLCDFGCCAPYDESQGRYFYICFTRIK